MSGSGSAPHEKGPGGGLRPAPGATVGRTAPSPYYDEGGITIYHGDCRDVLPSLEHVDLVLTDPPYNVGINYGTHDDSMDDIEYWDWCKSWWKLARDVSDRLILFPGHGNLWMWNNVIQKPTAVGCWHKPGNPAGGGAIQFCEWEPWLLWGKGIGGSDVVRATVSEQPDTGDHPCPKPLKLFTALLAQAKASSVVDPFMGSGTTLRAAKDLGRRAIGIEIEERYCETAAKRLGQEVFDFNEAA